MILVKQHHIKSFLLTDLPALDCRPDFQDFTGVVFHTEERDTRYIWVFFS
jgi:hypothetical protein